MELSGLGFKSANDCPHRDPNSVTVEIWKDDDWHAIDEFDLDFSPMRWETKKFAFFDVFMTTKVRCQFVNSKGHHEI